MSDDRRRFPRFSLPEATRAEFYQSAAEADSLPGRPEILVSFETGRRNWAQAPLDISEGGLQLVVVESLEPGTRVYGRIDVDPFAERIKVQGEVRWCYRSPQRAGAFYAGIMFTDLPPEERRAILLVRHCLIYVRQQTLKAIRKAAGPPSAP